MNMLDNIKYIFQIPLVWFRRVAAFCFKSYGGNLIKITRDKDGAAAFDVDEEELKGAVERFVGVNSTNTAQTLTGGLTSDRNVHGSDSWTRGSQDAVCFVVSRVDKSAGGVAKLFLRQMRIAASGHVISIAAEDVGVEVI